MSELDQYDYTLPQELIAQQPLPRRCDARLLVVERARGALSHRHVRDLPELLRAGDCLVLNDTRVVPARLVGRRTLTGGRWEGLFLAADAHGFWRILGKTRGRLAPGETITLEDCQGREDVRLRLAARGGEGGWIARPESDEEVLPLLERVGRIPLPPYIRKGEMVPADRQRYQTVYAATPGAVAAPTAGLHFTEPLLARLEAQGVAICRLTLHVGLGTFRPITAGSLADHTMHAEWGRLNEATAGHVNARRAAGGRIVAVGTTCVRVLESATDEQGRLCPFSGTTDLFIRPPYRFRAVDALMTNFHLPRTTLLVLVRTFGGDDLIRRAYEQAIAEQYRFYSYGDAMLIV
ncbi:MAG: tRNA preQ1(34) S-adenosylmethionine ribosyltransferase-isomerase QueA [Pirellulales bacterium]|nr:tRNA preQ1(34) S-adenosylmethionine ribosyltransferase-isomerase QueA [Pirellulales bacterium]